MTRKALQVASWSELYHISQQNRVLEPIGLLHVHHDSL